MYETTEVKMPSLQSQSLQSASAALLPITSGSLGDVVIHRPNEILLENQKFGTDSLGQARISVPSMILSSRPISHFQSLRIARGPGKSHVERRY
jgi:hypothetical protein